MDQDAYNYCLIFHLFILAREAANPPPDFFIIPPPKGAPIFLIPPIAFVELYFVGASSALLIPPKGLLPNKPPLIPVAAVEEVVVLVPLAATLFSLTFGAFVLAFDGAVAALLSSDSSAVSLSSLFC